MLVAVTVVSANLQESHRRWKLESIPWPKEGANPKARSAFPEVPLSRVTWPKEGFRLIEGGDHDLGPAFEVDTSFGGLMFIIDLEEEQIIWQRTWGSHLATPSGFCFDGKSCYVADLEGSNIFQVDMEHEPGRLLRRISHPALNDVHYLVPTRRGLLVASTGVDLALEIDLDGNTLCEWWAGDYGYTATGAGLRRLPEKERDHRGQYYHTRFHTTHLNAARYRDAEESRLLALLWSQGQLVEIDVTVPPEQRRPRVVLDGLLHPHTIRPLSWGGFMVANTQGEELIVLDDDLRVHDRIPSIGGWIQDALSLGPDRWLVADVNNCRLLVQDNRGHICSEVPYNQDWRVFGLQVLPQELRKTFTARADYSSGGLAVPTL